MTKKEYESLKVGDYVSPLRGKNKGKLCIVKELWDGTDDTGYREILIGAVFIDPELSNNKDWVLDLFISYKAFKKEVVVSLIDTSSTLPGLNKSVLFCNRIEILKGE